MEKLSPYPAIDTINGLGSLCPLLAAKTKMAISCLILCCCTSSVMLVGRAGGCLGAHNIT
ncbi:hypothetical protein [Bartonella sp. DGB2]|uniref:hypothetical protein n=1 Tax=Bartonella sp. DGB2 TaxID=3388426 RepID=UPI00398FE075